MGSLERPDGEEMRAYADERVCTAIDNTLQTDADINHDLATGAGWGTTPCPPEHFLR